MPGEMARIARVAKPTVAVITNIGVSHIEFMKTRENILAEKFRIADYLPAGGAVFVTPTSRLEMVESIPLPGDSADFAARTGCPHPLSSMASRTTSPDDPVCPPRPPSATALVRTSIFIDLHLIRCPAMCQTALRPAAGTPRPPAGASGFSDPRPERRPAAGSMVASSPRWA